MGGPEGTARLHFRAWADADAATFLDLYRRADVVRYLGSGPQPCVDLQDARQRIERWSGRVVDGEGLWAIVRREDGRPIGTALLLRLSHADGGLADAVEIGWHLHPDAWGHGYATEAGGALVALARAQGRADVRAVLWPDNVRSAAVCERLGMRRYRITDDWFGVDLVEYRLPTPGLTTQPARQVVAARVAAVSRASR